MDKKKVLSDRYYIVMSLDDPKVENMLVVYALENHICNYPVDWVEQVLKCFDQKFVEPRIIDIKDGKSGNFLFYDGKKQINFLGNLKNKMVIKNRRKNFGTNRNSKCKLTRKRIISSFLLLNSFINNLNSFWQNIME